MKSIVTPSLFALMTLLLVGTYAPDANAKKKRKKRKKGPDICKMLDAAPVKALLGDHTEMVSMRGSCAFMAKFDDADARSKACAKLAMASAGNGRKFKASDCAPTMNRVNVSERRQFDSAEKAKRVFKEYRSNNEKGVTVSVSGSRDKGLKSKVKIGGKKVSEKKSEKALKQAQEQVKVKLPNNDEVDQTRTFQSATKTVKIKNVNEAFYVVKGRTLMIRKGKRIITITLEIEGKNEDEQLEAASKLVEAWFK